MCNTTKPSVPPPSSPSPLKNQNQLLHPNNKSSYDPILDSTTTTTITQDELQRWPSPSEVVEEMRAIGKISIPTTLTGLVLYSRSMISMLFLGYLGELELAGGSLSIGFANITGYSVLSGLAMGMEPICGQAFGAKQRKLMSLTLQRTVLLLLSASVPISILWLNVNKILVFCGQDKEISSTAAFFLAFAIPDLILLSFLHPLRVYLRTQNITLPLTYCSTISVILHLPLNYLLVVHFQLGIVGVALAMVWTNLNLLIFLLLYVVFFSGVLEDSWVRPGIDCFRGWSTLLRLALPTCASVCLEWWWYELMIMLCGLLPNPKATVASMGILIQTTSLVYVFPSSLSLGVSTRVGNELGGNNPTRARVSAIVGIGCSIAMGFAAMTFTTSIRDNWGKMFTSDATILKLTSLVLPIVGLCELGNCPQTTGCGVLRGSARPTTGANINFGSFYLVGMPVAMILGFVLSIGFPGLWLGMLAAQVSCAAMMMFVLVRMDWLVEVERARELTRSSPPTNTINGGNKIESTIKEEKKGHQVVDLEEILCVGDESDHEVTVNALTPLETDPLIPNYPQLIN